MRIYIPVISILLLHFDFLSAHRNHRRSDCEAPSSNRPTRHRRHEGPHYSPNYESPDYSIGVHQHEPINRVTTAPSSSNCSEACQYRDKYKQLKLELIQEDILRKLRLTKPPNVTIPDLLTLPGQMQHIREKFGMMNDQPSTPSYDIGDDYHATTEIITTLGKKPPGEKINPEYRHENVVYFDLKRDLAPSSIERATLGLYVRRPRGMDYNSQHPNTTIIMIDKILSNTNDSTCRFKYKKINLSKRGTTNKIHQFDVTRMVQNWKSNSDKNFGLKIVSDTLQDGRPMVVTSPGLNEGHQTPYIELVLKQPRNSRAKRNLITLDCPHDSTEKRCCRYNLEVDFEQFEWDWIIAPKRYQAYFCSGDCDFTFLQKYPHSHVLQQVRGTGGGPCCAPTKLSPISMLYFDDHGNILYGNLPGMVVDRCGCS